MGLALPGPVRTVVTPPPGPPESIGPGFTASMARRCGVQGSVDLVAVVGLKAQAVAKHTQVAVRVHKTRDDVAPRPRQSPDRPPPRAGADMGADGSDFAVPGGHKAVFQ